MVEFIPIEKGNYLRENEFVLKHKCRYWYCTNLQFQVRLVEKNLHNYLYFNNFKELSSILTGQQWIEIINTKSTMKYPYALLYTKMYTLF